MTEIDSSQKMHRIYLETVYKKGGPLNNFVSVRVILFGYIDSTLNDE